MKYQSKLQNNPCSECGKVGVYTNGLCQACYAKMRRNTPEGKERQKIYNATKAKEATKRWKEKQLPKPPKPPKETIICECGKIAITKGLCMICYQKYYQRKKYNFKPRSKKIIDWTKLFELVLHEVKHGCTIQDACKKMKIDRLRFYKNISEVQKTLLRSIKSIYVHKNETVVYDECDRL